MHELSVTESILETALRYARQNEAKRVTDLYLVIGQLASIVDDSVQFYWDIISRGSLCDGSKLHFQRILATLSCLDCGRDYSLNGELTPCPFCSSAKVQVTSGDQFFLDSIEIEK